MKTIQYFEAKDGKKFANHEKCTLYERELKELEALSLGLGKQRTDTDFQNGGGYIQHSPEVVKSVTKSFSAYLNKKLRAYYNLSFVGRVLQDSGMNHMYALWHRLECIDDLGREWGQMYYKLHPEDAKQVKLN